MGTTTKTATTETTAYGLSWPGNEGGSGSVMDISYIAGAETVWVVERSCNFDRTRELSVAEAREHYREHRARGWEKSEPTYRSVEVDEFGRTWCRHGVAA